MKIKKVIIVVLITLILVILAGVYFNEVNNEKTNTLINNNEQNNLNNNLSNSSKIEELVDNKVFAIESKRAYLYDKYDEDIAPDYRGIKLLEYDNTNKYYAEIYFVSNDYTTEPSYYYTVEVKNSKNESLLIGGKNEELITRWNRDTY